MYMITGEKLSAVQAKDLLKYMDANEDGVVGREDFKHFISVGRLKDTKCQRHDVDTQEEVQRGARYG